MKVMLLLTLSLALHACSGSKNSSKTKAKTFVYCSEGSPSIFNPQLATDGTTYNASSKTIYDRLTRFEYGTTRVLPSLAKEWSISPDGKEVTFILNKGVQFHKTKDFTPSRNFNADDVLFTFNRMRLKGNPYHKVGGGSYEYFNAMEMGSLIKGIQKVSDYEIKFTLNRPEAPFVANLAMDFASILSKEYADHLAAKNQKDKIDTTPVGTGPFKFKSYSKDSLIRFTANSEYFRGAPKIANLIFAITPDASVRYQKLKTGECHLIAHPSPTDLKSMKENSDIQILDQPGLNVAYLAMNVNKKPFNNSKVRQAINFALNKQSYIDAIYLGQGQVAKNPIPPTMWSYNENTEDQQHSVETAKKLLSEAGYPNGFETELWTLPVSRPYNPNGKKMGEMMQADLAKIGIKAKLVSYDWPTYLEKSKNGEHQMLQLGWTGDNGDPDNFLHVLLSCSAAKAGSNRAGWCDKNYDKLVEEAKVVSDQAKRAKLYKEAQLLFKKESPWVPIAHSITHKALRKNVTGYKVDPLGSDYFYHVDL